MKLARVLLHFRDNIWASDCTTTPPLGHWVQSAGIGSKRFFAENAFFLFSAFFSRPVLSVLWSTFPGFRLAGCEEKTPLAGNWSSQPTKVPLCQYVQMNHDYHLAKIEHTPEKFSWPCSTKWVPEHTKRSPRSGQGSHHISESSWKEYFWNFFLVSPTIFAGK